MRLSPTAGMLWVMNKQITAVHQHGRHVIAVPTWRWLPWLSLAVLAAWLLHLVWPAADAVDDSLPLESRGREGYGPTATDRT